MKLLRIIKHWLMSESADEHELLLKVLFVLMTALMIFVIVMKVIGVILVTN